MTIDERTAAAFERIADALEQLVLKDIPADPYPARLAPVDDMSDLEPVKPVVVNVDQLCPIHRTPWKTVPAGVSKKTGKPYSAFQACSTQGCDQRPPR